MARSLAPDGAFATVDGVRLHYHYHRVPTQKQSDPVLVFLHGASGSAYDTRLAFEAIYRGRSPVLFVDRPGLGFSERGRDEHVPPAGQAHLIAGLLDELEIETAVVVGHSLAGSVTTALGLAAPERVKGLAFLAPVTHVWPGGVNWYYSLAALPVIGWLFVWTLTLPVGERLAPAMMRNVFHPDPAVPDYAGAIRLPLLFRPHSFRANAEQICSVKEAVRTQAARYVELSQPALVVTGTEDTVVWPSIHCEGLIRDLPDVETLLLDLAGHMPHHTHTTDICAALDRLVTRVTAKEADGLSKGAPETLQPA
ncbi:alpha/beta fold hydrolase [Roseibium sediminicola]|uniref:Alpha/beta hydrolase n=1 Tax=Roseibium sediminicola TaxID=2933272 RepID=A0ABT0GVN4_9HYPH|nr:alpha/beta hydrolase [Roseibium sp. CAU 1639]MCK7613107.1 alpha/beta hydrolase [Roseibium sp. CAU 1639]